MSRKRKRRGRGPLSNADVNQRQDQDDDIEIVDDVDLLDKQAPAPASADPAVATPAVAESVPTAAAETSPADEAGERHDVEGTDDTAVAASAVHVVEPLHESPQTSAEGERTVETLGELLQHAREARGLSLEEVSARTRIALLTLRHLENDRFGELPAEAYVKGFLRSYGSFLSLDVSMLLRRYEKLSGHVSTPVAEIWEEVDVERSGGQLWRPSRRSVAIASAVLVVAALAWVFWSQGAVMLGLRPAGELQQIEMQLQREAQDGNTPTTSITGLDDAALQQDSDHPVQESGVDLANPPSTAGPSTQDPATQEAKVSTVEDAAPPVPLPPVKPAVTVQPQVAVPAVSPEESKPQPTDAEKKAAAQAAKKPAAVNKPEKKPEKKPAPAPSPEDAAGPPA